MVSHTLRGFTSGEYGHEDSFSGATVGGGSRLSVTSSAAVGSRLSVTGCTDLLGDLSTCG